MMSQMQNITVQWLTSLKHYLLMTLLLSSPERLPYSPQSTLLTVMVYFMLGSQLVDEQRSASMVNMQILLELVMLGLIAFFGLRWKKLLPRFQQTFSALVGINVVISAAAIPAYRMAGAGSGDPDSTLIYVTLAILVWNLAVLSLIFKRAFEISTQLSAVISFNYFVVYQFMTVWLY